MVIYEIIEGHIYCTYHKDNKNKNKKLFDKDRYFESSIALMYDDLSVSVILISCTEA